MPSRLEQPFERVPFASRRLMAAVQSGLMFALGILALIFVREIIEFLPHVIETKGKGTILLVMTLIDFTLAGKLLLIVWFSVL